MEQPLSVISSSGIEGLASTTTTTTASAVAAAPTGVAAAATTTTFTTMQIIAGAVLATVALGAVMSATGLGLGLGLGAAGAPSQPAVTTVDDYLNLTLRVPYIFDPTTNDIDEDDLQIFLFSVNTLPRYGTCELISYTNGTKLLNITMTSDEFMYDENDHLAPNRYDTLTYQPYNVLGRVGDPGTIHISVYNVPPLAVDFEMNVFQDSNQSQYRLFEESGRVNRSSSNRYAGHYGDVEWSTIRDLNRDPISFLDLKYASYVVSPSSNTSFFNDGSTVNNDPSHVNEQEMLESYEWEASSGTFKFTPPRHFIGSVLFEYIISDLRGPSTRGLITVHVLDTAPSVHPVDIDVEKYDASVVDLLSQIVDPNGDVIRLVSIEPLGSTLGSIQVLLVSNNDGNGTIETEQQIVYVPAQRSVPYEDTFEYAVTDGTKTSMSTVTIHVVNRAPTTEPYVLKAVSKEPGNHAIEIAYEDADSLDSHTISIAQGPEYGAAHVTTQNVTVPVNRTVIIGGSLVTNSFNVTRQVFTVLYNRNQSVSALQDSLHIAISDGNDVAQSKIELSIVNFPPVAVDDYVVIEKNGNITLDHLLDNDYDPDEDSFVLQPASDSGTWWFSLRGGIVRRISDTQLQYIAPFNYTGEDEFQYTIIDQVQSPFSSKRSVVPGVVHVEIENVKPIIHNDYYRIKTGGVVQLLNVLANDTSSDGVPLVIVAVEQASQDETSSVRIFNSTTIEYTSGSYPGTIVFQYTVRDGSGFTYNGTVYIELYEDTPTYPSCPNALLLFGSSPIWPPNQFMRLNWLIVPNYAVKIISILHNDVYDLYGPDAYILPFGIFGVRAERSGREKTGRVYKIHYIARRNGKSWNDPSAICTGTITSLCVPHDKSKAKEQCAVRPTDQWIDATTWHRRQAQDDNDFIRDCDKLLR